MLDHCRNHGHVISKNNVEVLAREERWFRRKVRKAIKIKTRQPTINRDQGFDLPTIYSKLLPFPRDRQTSGHSPLSSGQFLELAGRSGRPRMLADQATIDSESYRTFPKCNNLWVLEMNLLVPPDYRGAAYHCLHLAIHLQRPDVGRCDTEVYDLLLKVSPIINDGSQIQIDSETSLFRSTFIFTYHSCLKLETKTKLLYKKHQITKKVHGMGVFKR